MCTVYTRVWASGSKYEHKCTSVSSRTCVSEITGEHSSMLLKS